MLVVLSLESHFELFLQLSLLLLLGLHCLLVGLFVVFGGSFGCTLLCVVFTRVVIFLNNFLIWLAGIKLLLFVLFEVDLFSHGNQTI